MLTVTVGFWLEPLHCVGTVRLNDVVLTWFGVVPRVLVTTKYQVPDPLLGVQTNEEPDCTTVRLWSVIRVWSA